MTEISTFLELSLLLWLHAPVYSCHATREILVALAADNKPGVEDEVAELVLGGEALDALD